MTVEPRFLDLMHGEIDGRNSEAQSATLRAFLALHPAAQEEFRRLEHLSEILSGVGEVDPPADLERSLVEAARAQRMATSPLLVRPERRAWTGGRTVLRYAYAVAAGLVLGFAVHRWAPTGLEGRNIDPSDLVGTITKFDSGAVFPAIRQIELNSPGMTGTARVRSSEAGFTIELDAESREPLLIALGYDPGHIGFRGFAQNTEAAQDLQAGHARIAWTQSGHQRVALVFEPRTTGASALDLELSLAGNVIRSVSIPLPGSK